MIRTLSFLRLILLLFLPTSIASGQQDTLASASIDLVMLNEEEQGFIKERLDHLREGLRAGDTTVFRLAIRLLLDDRGYQRRGYFGRDSVEVWREARSLLLSYGDIMKVRNLKDESGRALADYLEKNKAGLKYSSLLGKFTDAPIEDREADYRIHRKAKNADDPAIVLAELKAEMKAAEIREDWFDHVMLVPRIGRLGTPEAFFYLKECANGAHWGQGVSNRDKQMKEALQRALGNFRTREAAELILAIAKELGDWGGKSFVGPLSRITGLRIGEYKSSKDSVMGAYRHLLDSLPSLPELRELGYRRSSELREDDFAGRSEYLVYLIRHNRHEWWLHGHAVRELIARRDPVVLRELAGGRYRLVGMLGGGRQKLPEEWLHELTNTAIELKDDKDGEVYTPLGKVSDEHFLIYWSRNYQHYEWSEETGRFVYRGEELVPEDPVTGYFNDLFSADDQKVFTAFDQLTDFAPDSIVLRAKPYHLKMVDRIISPRIVGLPYQSQLGSKIALLAGLKAYCRSKSLPVAGPEGLGRWLAGIDRAGKEEDWMEESKGLETLLTVDDLTGLEMYTILGQKRYPRAIKAVGMMLTIWYGTRWSEIVADPVALRLYLKKFSVYPKTGIRRGWGGFGSQLVEMDNETFAALREVLRSETDDDILDVVERAVVREEIRRKESFTVAEYMGYAKGGEAVDLDRVVIDTSASGLTALFSHLNTGDDAQVQATVNLIGHHLNDRMTPYLLASADDKRLFRKSFVSWRSVKEGRQTIRYNIVVGDLMVSYLERLHKHKFLVERERPWTRAMASSSGGLTEYWGKHLTAEEWRAWIKER
jgi:hypothetical protein